MKRIICVFLYKLILASCFIISIAAKAEYNLENLVSKDTKSIVSPENIKEIPVENIEPPIKSENSELNSSSTPQEEAPNNPDQNLPIKIEEKPKEAQPTNPKQKNDKNDLGELHQVEKPKEAEISVTTPPKNENKPLSPTIVKPSNEDVSKIFTGNRGKEVLEKKSYIYSDWAGSLMFTKEDLDNINKAIIDSYAPENKDDFTQKEGSKNLNNANYKVTLKAPEQIPSFYFASILYKSPEDWVIWINKKEIRSNAASNIQIDNDNDNNIEILKLYEKYAIVKWRTIFLDSYFPDWRNILDKGTNRNYYSADNNIVVDEDSKTVIFKLKVNQTFAVNKMVIKEGYIPPVKLEQTTIDKSIEEITNSISKN